MQELWITLVAGLAAVVGQLRLTSRPDRVRRRIAATAELRDSLVETAAQEVVSALDTLIAEQVEYLAKVERKSMERRLDPAAGVVALVIVVMLCYVSYLLWHDGDGWAMDLVALGFALAAVLTFVAGLMAFLSPARTQASATSTSG